MANRRSLQALTRHCPSIFSSNTSLRTFTTRPSLQPLSSPDPLSLSNPNHSLLPVFRTPFGYQYNSIRRFSIRDKFFGKNRNRDEEEEEEVDLGEGEEDDDDDEDEEDESDDEEEEEGERVSNANISRTYSVEEKAEEAAAIGYKVLGPLDPTERPFKWREPVFAVVQIGSHQFKVSNGDYIYAERLKFCEVNDKLLLSKVLMLGSQTQTIIGRPTLPEASVYAVVEEHALDAKVIIFKKKRRKNYRRTKGHRQELTRLRITDIQGVEKPVKLEKPAKPVRVRQPQPEMDAVPA